MTSRTATSHSTPSDGKGLVDKDTSAYPHTYRLAPPFLNGAASGEGEQTAGRTENWRLIKDAAHALTAAGQTPFTRQSAYEWIWRRYPRGIMIGPASILLSGE